MTATVQRYADLLREDDDGWAKAGAALAEARQWWLAAAWLGDWKERAGLKPWMLRPLADALRALGRDAEANDLIRATVTAAGPADVPAEFLAWLALIDAIDGKTADAAAHLKAVDRIGQPDGTQLLLSIAGAVVSVQQAPAGEKATVFAEAKENVKAAAGACDVKEVPPGLSRWWRRAADRLAADAGCVTAKLWAWWQRVGPWVKEA